MTYPLFIPEPPPVVQIAQVLAPAEESATVVVTASSHPQAETDTNPLNPETAGIRSVPSSPLESGWGFNSEVARPEFSASSTHLSPPLAESAFPNPAHDNSAHYDSPHQTPAISQAAWDLLPPLPPANFPAKNPLENPVEPRSRGERLVRGQESKSNTLYLSPAPHLSPGVAPPIQEPPIFTRSSRFTSPSSTSQPNPLVEAALELSQRSQNQEATNHTATNHTTDMERGSRGEAYGFSVYDPLVKAERKDGPGLSDANNSNANNRDIDSNLEGDGEGDGNFDRDENLSETPLDAADPPETNLGNPDPENLDSENSDSGRPRPALSIPAGSSPDGPIPEFLTPPLDPFGIVELTADRQDYDQRRNLVTGEGNAFLRFRDGELRADHLQFNTDTQVLMARGNVRLVRGRQRLEGEFLEYNLVQEKGIIEPGSGEIFASTSGTDLNFDQTPSVPLSSVSGEPISGVARVDSVMISTGFGTNFGGLGGSNTGNPGNEIALPLNVSTFNQEGMINHWRFQAEQIELLPEGWNAHQVQMTNDPFSPPQFEIRAKEAQYREITPLVSELRANRPRYVFEDFFPFPTFRNRVLIDRRPQESGLFTIGIDNEDRGGVFIERSYEPISRDNFRFTLTPQFLVQKAFVEEGGNIATPSAFALKAGISATPRPGTSITGSLIATDLGSAFGGFLSSDDDDAAFEDTLRGNVRASQQLPWQHTLALESSFRDRLFNGSLGFQTVQRSLGAVFVSPNWTLGNTGINLTYQAGVQYINADTDRADLLEANRDNNRVNLTRYQTSARLSRGFTLWRGEPLSATPDQGLRYTPTPVVPAITMGVSTTGTYSGYSNGDIQDSLTGSVGATGVFGHFSRSWLDYTQLNVSYSQALRGSTSPFLFDRLNDTRVLSFGFKQQIYGPIRFGFNTSLNLETDDPLSVNYVLEYNRRAFDVALRFNPELEIGSVLLRIHDFNWQGQPAQF